MARREVAVEPIEFLMARETVEDTPEAAPARKRTPHERGRRGRKLGVTFPSEGWAEAVRELAGRWGVRPGDVLVLAVARLMADVEGGEVDGPRRPAGFQERAGGMFDLPWEAG